MMETQTQIMRAQALKTSSSNPLSGPEAPNPENTARHAAFEAQRLREEANRQTQLAQEAKLARQTQAYNEAQRVFLATLSPQQYEAYIAWCNAGQAQGQE